MAVAEHRAADVVEMHADLVRPAGLGPHPKGRVAVETLDDFVEGLGRAAVGVVAADGHLLPLMRVDADRQVDQVAVAIGRPATRAKYSLRIARCWNWGAQKAVGQVVLGHQDHAAGVAVEAVDDAGPGGTAGRAQPPPKWCCKALASVPDQWPRAGWTTIRGGLLITASQSSS